MLCSHWIKAISEKTQLVLKGFLQNGAEKKHRDSSPVYFNIMSKGVFAKFVTENDFLHERNIR